MNTNYYFNIQPSMVKGKGLNSNDKLIYFYLINCIKTGFQPSTDYIASELEITRKTVSSSVNKLFSNGLINIAREYNSNTKKTTNTYSVPMGNDKGYALGEDVVSLSIQEVPMETTIQSSSTLNIEEEKDCAEREEETQPMESLITEQQIKQDEEVIIKDDKVSQIEEKEALKQSIDEILTPEPVYMRFSGDDSLTEKDINKLNRWYSNGGQTYPYAYITKCLSKSFLEDYHVDDFLTMYDSTYIVAAGETTTFKLIEYFNLLLKNNDLGKKL